MVLFKRRLLELVLQRRKTQTRRVHKRELTPRRIYPITDRWYRKPEGFIRVTRKFYQRLGDISETEAKAEGFNSLADFQKAWKSINGEWNPDQIVVAYEFELVG